MKLLKDISYFVVFIGLIAVAVIFSALFVWPVEDDNY